MEAAATARAAQATAQEAAAQASAQASAAAAETAAPASQTPTSPTSDSEAGPGMDFFTDFLEEKGDNLEVRACCLAPSLTTAD